MPGLDFIKTAAAKDINYYDIAEAIKHGKDVSKLPPMHAAHLFAKDWDKLSLEDGLIILDGHRILVP